MNFKWKNMEDNASPMIRKIRIILLVAIIIGIGLIATRDSWVPKLVDAILKADTSDTLSLTITTDHPAATTSAPSVTPVARAGRVDTGVELIATIGPTCAVVRFPDDGSCADKPYQTTLVLASTIIGKNGGILIQTGADGYFSRELTPGTYTIRAQSSNFYPRLTPVTFTVTPHHLVSLNLKFDSGIR